MAALQIVSATPDQAARLTEIVFAAKRHWGYPEKWIQGWRLALTITPEYVAANPCFAAKCDGLLVGFGALRFAIDGAWIDHMWVLPQAMGRGIGRQLFEACEAEARRSGAKLLKIESDPNSVGFYQRMGAVEVSRIPPPISDADRELPLMEKILS
ncbi:MAG TPA: GNAT family N-acetyltransferase [Candidatus Didemnitutus sp.]|nr:GNAT family N-acetyltransferase [Candidatus Didemnitutus sp.]